jgi:hypothetical protein
MDTSTPPISENIPKVELPAPVKEQISKKKGIPWQIILGACVPILLLIAGLVYLFLAPAEQTARIRDIFIILMAFMSLAIGLVLIILIVQIAELTNLLKTEIKPVIDSANETANNLRGTTEFLGKNMVEPVVKLNEYAAAIKKIFELVNLGRKPK